MNKLPAFQFYPGDWMKDPNLRRCSHAAKGVWIDILCLAFECDERGVLVAAGRPWTIDEIACAVGGNSDVTLRCIQELIDKGVVRKRDDGAFYSSRMVTDEKERQQNRDRVNKSRSKKDETGEKRPSNGECNAPCNGDVMVMSHHSSSSTSTTVEEREREQARAKYGRQIPKNADEVRKFAASMMPTSVMPRRPDDRFIQWWWSDMESINWVDTRTKLVVHDWQSAFEKAWLGRCHKEQESAANQRRQAPISAVGALTGPVKPNPKGGF